MPVPPNRVRQGDQTCDLHGPRKHYGFKEPLARENKQANSQQRAKHREKR